jgi:hypothetical protein
MKTLRSRALILALALAGVAAAQSAADRGSAREKLIGAWHLIAIEAPGPNGKVVRDAAVTGSLIYMRDGHMSVQLMYPASESGLSNDYVKNGYEASFGHYDVDEAAHTVTHHVEGSITPGLVGKDLTRGFRFVDGRLIIQSTQADEHWSVTWAHN